MPVPKPLLMETVTNEKVITDFFTKEIDPLEFVKYIDNAQNNKVKVLSKEGIVIAEQDEDEMYWLRNFRNKLMQSKGVYFFED